MVMRQHGQAVGADFVRHVAVGRDAVRADPDGVDLAARHQAGRHRIGDQLKGDRQLAQLPGGKASALQQRARFTHPDVRHLTLLVRAGDDAQRGADARRRQPAGVAVRKQAAVRLHQRAARLGDVVAQLAILLDQTQRFLAQCGGKIRMRQRQLHSIEIIHQVDRRGTRGAQHFQRLRQRVAAGARLGQQRQQQRGGEADQRRAAHAQGVNMANQLRHVVRRQPVFLLRQRLLIEDPELTVTNL